MSNRINNFDENYIYKILKKNFKKNNKNFLNNIGDDASILKLGNKKYAVSCDIQIENVHFSFKYSKPEEISYRAVIVAISDLLAMGARPEFFLNSLNIKKGTSSKIIDKIFYGFKKAARDFNLELIGGNVSSSKQFSLDLTVIGVVKKKYIPRGSSVGQNIYITDNLGTASAGLKILKNKKKYEGLNVKKIIQAYIKPELNIHKLNKLISTNLIKSMIDVTDGLTIDLKRLIKYKDNSLGASIIWEKIPIERSLYKFFNQKTIENLVMNGGDDYKFLFTVDEKDKKVFESKIKSKKIKVHNIGNTDNTGVIKLIKSGMVKKIDSGGFLHRF